jgi:hypothetical protein
LTIRARAILCHCVCRRVYGHFEERQHLGMIYCPTPTLIAGPNVRLNLNFRFY